MQNLEITSVLIWLLGAVAAIYFTVWITHEWAGRWYRAAKRRVRRAVVSDSSLDVHIATQWSEGRLRLDSLLALIKTLRASLEREVEVLRRLDPADLLYEREARNQVTPALRRHAFDKHLQNECHALIPLLQFCAQDLAGSQDRDMTQQLTALAEIQAAVESVGRD